MKCYTLLTTVALVWGLFLGLSQFGVSAEGFEDIVDIESYEPIDIPLPFLGWANENAWKGSIASPHIVGGNEAVPHAYPHQVLLAMKREKNGEKQKGGLCGGSLITDSWVLTAAHCIDKKIIFRDPWADLSDKYKVGFTIAAGVHNISEWNSTDASNVQLSNISQIIAHPDWSLFALKNDIALLKLEKNFDFNEFVKPIRLPKLSQVSESFDGSLVTMTGWGMTNPRMRRLIVQNCAKLNPKDPEVKKPAAVLQKVDSEVVSNLYCKFRYLFLLVRDTNICVSAWGAKGVCKGDSGGPLIIKEADGEPTVIGITSFSLGCTWGFPGAFTRVTSYLNWIHSTTGITLRT